MTDEEDIAQMSEDRLSKLIDLNQDDVVDLVLEEKYQEAKETAEYVQLLIDELNKR